MLCTTEQERQNAIQTLLDCEEEFVSHTQYGLTHYVRPLAQQILQQQQHEQIFQNIVTVVLLYKLCFKFGKHFV